jgi:nucleoside-diphosphate-sugar epimerase
MKIAITGSSGFIGSALKNACIARGIQSVSLCRKPKTNDIFFDLSDPQTFKHIPRDVSVLVHTAYTTQGRDFKHAYTANIEGSLALFDFCHKAHIPILFLSSCSAHENAKSFYGRSKSQLESNLLPTDTIIRPGFVIGKGGIYQRLEQSIKTLKFAPLFWGGQQPLQYVHLDELVNGILEALMKNRIGAYTLAHPISMPIQEFYRQIFLRLGLKPRFCKLPGDLALLALKVGEFLKLPLPLTSENLLGLKYMKVFDSDCKKLGIKTREFTL